jgi:hypothetical protein
VSGLITSDTIDGRRPPPPESSAPAPEPEFAIGFEPAENEKRGDGRAKLDGVRGRDTGDWSRMWSIICSRTARWRRHILHRILRRPWPPIGVGGFEAVGVAGYLAILSMGGAEPSPSNAESVFRCHSGRHDHSWIRHEGPVARSTRTHELRGGPLHVKLPGRPVSKRNFAVGIAEQAQLVPESLRRAMTRISEAPADIVTWL